MENQGNAVLWVTPVRWKMIKGFCYSSAYLVFKTASPTAFAFQSRMLWTERPNGWPRAAEANFSFLVASGGHVCAQGSGGARADGQEQDSIRQHWKPTARPGCPDTHRTKANKLEPSREHSAKAVCQREIPKDYGLEPRMWGEGVKEVHLKLTEFPSPPIALQCPQDWRGLSVEQVSGWGVELLWKNPGEWAEVSVRVNTSHSLL